MGGTLLFFQNFSWYRVPKGVVPSDFFQISVGTRYQNGWVVHFFLQIQLVPTFGYGLVPNILTPPPVFTSAVSLIRYVIFLIMEQYYVPKAPIIGACRKHSLKNCYQQTALCAPNFVKKQLNFKRVFCNVLRLHL